VPWDGRIRVLSRSPVSTGMQSVAAATATIGCINGIVLFRPLRTGIPRKSSLSSSPALRSRASRVPAAAPDDPPTPPAAQHSITFLALSHEKEHIPSDLVVDHLTSAVESSSPLDVLSLHVMWTPCRRLISYKVMSVISVGCDFTTKSGGIWKKGMGKHRRGSNSESGMRLLRRLEKNHDGIRSAATRQHYIQIYQAIKYLSLDIADFIEKGPQMPELPRV
jgi:hypothetical protein